MAAQENPLRSFKASLIKKYFVGSLVMNK